MICNPFSPKNSAAVKAYTRGILLTMSGYVFAVSGTSAYVHHHHPHGPLLFVLCAIPSFCILSMLGVVAIYLRDEHDEYQRMLVVRSLLWATFVVLALSAYTDFLRAFGNLPGLPPFAEFVTFWLVFGPVQAVQSIAGARGSHE
jgi:RsiW-degrading membrane proteinase PrsW (M82 family)